MWTIGIILVIVVLAIPAVRRFFGSILTGAAAFAGGGLAIVAWLSIIIVVFCSAIGADFGSWKAGALFGAIIAFFLVRKIGGAISVLLRRTPATATGSFFTSILTSVAVIAALMMFGIPERVAPNMWKSVGRFSKDMEKDTANKLDKRSLGTEAENGGAKAQARCGAPAYSMDAVVVVHNVQSENGEDIVKVPSLEKDKDDLLTVVFKNKNGNYVGGLKLRMAFDDLDFNSTATKQESIHSVKVVMNNPSGVKLELKSGRYRFWAGDAPRLQAVDGNSRMIQVWPDGRTSDRPTMVAPGREGYYDQMATQDQNPIPGAPTMALIVWGKNGPQTFRKEGGIIEVEVADTATFDLNVPRGYAEWFTNNGGENVIYYQRHT